MRGRGLYREHRRHARLHHQLELVRVLAMRVHACVGSEGDLHAGLVGAPRSA